MHVFMGMYCGLFSGIQLRESHHWFSDWVGAEHDLTIDQTNEDEGKSRMKKNVNDIVLNFKRYTVKRVCDFKYFQGLPFELFEFEDLQPD